MYVNPAALFSTVEPSTTKHKRTCYHNVQQKLIEKKLPTQNDWHKAFLESWHNVKKTVSEPQPFFLLSEQTVSDELTKLAKATYEVCKQNEKLFKSHVIDTIDETKETVDVIEGDLKELIKKLNQQKIADKQQPIDSTIDL